MPWILRLRLVLVRIFPIKPLPRGHIQINSNGLNQDVRVNQLEARDNGPSNDLINTVPL